MQPYLFPHLGYFQLVHVADTFVFLDDVEFIKQGWINRNRLLVQSRAAFFSVPIEAASSFRPIHETKISQQRFPLWKKKFLKTFSQNYPRGPNFDEAYDLVDNIFSLPTNHISELAEYSVRQCCEFLDIDVNFKRSSTDFNQTDLSGVDRILNICESTGCVRYVNASGGRQLYRQGDFSPLNVELCFLIPDYLAGQSTEANLDLSILHLLAIRGREGTKLLMDRFSLLCGE